MGKLSMEWSPVRLMRVLGATWLSAIWHGATRLGAIQLGATQLGATRLGATRLGATRLGVTQLGVTLLEMILLGMILGSGCSVLVEPPSVIRCEVVGADPCGPSAVCRDGICVELGCGTGIEECDGMDNDCDDLIDEGLAEVEETCNGDDDNCNGLVDEDFDQDGDGYTPCGTSCNDGVCTLDPDTVDCNDGVRDVNPGAAEQCDAIDHDCDGSAVTPGGVEPDLSAPRDALCSNPSMPWCEPSAGCVEANCFAPRLGAACTGGEVCDPQSGQCRRVGCTPLGCIQERGADFFCSPESGECERRRDNGESCSADEGCMSEICASSAALGAAGSRGNGVCVQPCCGDDDCAGDEFCWDPGTGARSCVPLSFSPELHGRTQIGASPAVAACSSDGQCRSGLCLNGACAGACRSSSECPSDSECDLVRRGDGRLVTICVAGLRPAGAFCSSAGQCAFDACFGTCVLESCRAGSDCGSGCQYAANQDSVFTFCSNRDSGACCRAEHCNGGEVCRPQIARQDTGQTFWPLLCAPER